MTYSTIVSNLAACLFVSHEPGPRGKPDPCAPALPTLPHHPVPRPDPVGSEHARDTAPCCPGATATATTTQLEGEGAHREGARRERA